MRNVKKLLKNKLGGHRGFTLVEMLAAVIMLILLVLMLGSGLNIAVQSYRTMIADSETEILMSSLSNAIYDELRYARDIDTTPSAGGIPGESPGTPTAEITGNLKKYTSASFGRNTTLALKDGQLYANGKRLVAAGAYGNGDYVIQQLHIEYDSNTRVFTVNLTVGGDENITATTVLTIRPLNYAKTEKGAPQA